MKYKIVLVPFPFDDLSATKVRPAVCLTNPISTYRHVVVTFITSQALKANEPSDVLIPNTDPDFSQTGLAVSSAIRLHRLATVPINLIQRELGDLPISFQFEVEQRLRQLFGL